MVGVVTAGVSGVVTAGGGDAVTGGVGAASPLVAVVGRAVVSVVTSVTWTGVVVVAGGVVAVVVVSVGVVSVVAGVDGALIAGAALTAVFSGTWGWGWRLRAVTAGAPVLTGWLRTFETTISGLAVTAA